MRVEILKAPEQTALNTIINNAFPAGVTKLVYDDSTIPVTDTISAYTDALAARASLISPIKGYPPTPK